MKKLILATSLAFSLCVCGAAQAQKLDLDKVKCGEWLKAPQEVITLTLAWIDGYYKDEDADPVIDFTALQKNAEKLAAACAKSPDRMLGAVAEELFGN